MPSTFALVAALLGIAALSMKARSDWVAGNRPRYSVFALLVAMTLVALWLGMGSWLAR